jgi:transmembrane sensor
VSDAKAVYGTANAREVRACAAAWLERRDCAEWCSEDQTALDAWLSESPAHRVAYLRADDAWKRADRLNALRSAAQVGDDVPNERRYLSALGKLAAGLAVVVAVGIVAAAYFLTPHTQNYATTIGGRETLVLADGSQIEMNTDTALRTSVSASQRKVWLDRGEAYFQIRHDAARPFVVMAGDHHVTDLGTKFLIRRDTDRLEVMLMEGRARFDAADADARSVVLTPGDLVVATAKTVSVMREPIKELSTDLSWRQGVLIFKHTTLADAAVEFNRYNQEKLIVADSAVANLMIGGTFPTNNVELFGHMAQIILGVRVQRQGGEVVISR